MSNHLDQTLLNADFELSDELSPATSIWQRIGTTDAGQDDESASATYRVKAGFDRYPVESGRDITGRWRPVWSEDAGAL
jgi:hypothetical protein